jgi:hypothetical protein
MNQKVTFPAWYPIRIFMKIRTLIQTAAWKGGEGCGDLGGRMEKRVKGLSERYFTQRILRIPKRGP